MRWTCLSLCSPALSGVVTELSLSADIWSDTVFNDGAPVTIASVPRLTVASPITAGLEESVSVTVASVQSCNLTALQWSYSSKGPFSNQTKQIVRH